MDDVRLAQLWRYPVKSLRGEALSVARLTPDGVDGDRVVHVAGPRGPLHRAHPTRAAHHPGRHRARRHAAG